MFTSRIPQTVALLNYMFTFCHNQGEKEQETIRSLVTVPLDRILALYVDYRVRFVVFDTSCQQRELVVVPICCLGLSSDYWMLSDQCL